MIVLENVAEGFRKPNILDVKLGTVLYDEDTPPEKRERMEKKARYTTSGEVGIRLTGFQVRRSFSSISWPEHTHTIL
jgi:inositol-polyphosphate multikinase